MYRRRLSQPFPTYPNLKILLLENKNVTGQCYGLTFMIRRASTAATTFENLQNVKKKMELFLKNSKLFGALRDKMFAVPRSLKDQSESLLRVWTHQCECVLAHRLRRGHQMFTLYSKLWEERALRDFIKQMRHRIGARGRDFIVGALGITAYDWQKNRISDNEIRAHKNEFDYIYLLRDKTLCAKCSKESIICQCDRFDGKKTKLASYDDWTVFIEKNDLVVWRRLHKDGNYEYKVYGSYGDVTAEDFLNVQVDIEYRRQWDTTAVRLNVVETDPDPKSHSDVVYWEMLWPKLFTNRDYVFHRRYLVDHQSKTLFLISKSTKHPSCPKINTKYRIEDYWSYMVIKPYTELNRPGIEFSLTYFDNPGVNVPASVTTWVAMKAMPDFLGRLREASKKYRSYCKESGLCKVCNIMEPREKDIIRWDYFDDEVIDNTIYEAHRKMKSEDKESEPSKTPPQYTDDIDNSNTSQGSNIQSENHSFWRQEHEQDSDLSEEKPACDMDK